MDLTTVAAYIFGLLLLYLVVRLFIVPIRFLVMLLYNCAIGAVMLWLFNLVAGAFGLHVPLNPVTILAAGLMGAPGVAMLAAVCWMLA
ncbi:MAG: pro-sigmaK processing inhibitor BofA family protein [Acetobacteraceae bacterium]|nr:pro-sigmaK processing inhibitor BofA family protein [Acetobacteraceae bacterium]